MTRKRAKELSLQVWKFLARTGLRKSGLPKYIEKRVENFPYYCPLCSLYLAKGGLGLGGSGCSKKCPLNVDLYDEEFHEVLCCNDFNNWTVLDSKHIEDRKKYARRIVRRISAWKV